MNLKNGLLGLILFLATSLSSKTHAAIFNLSDFDRAKNAHAQKNYSQAEELYQKVIAKDSKHLEAHLYLAGVQFQQKQFKEAQTNIEKGIEFTKEAFFFREDSRKKLLIKLYNTEAHIAYAQFKFLEATKSFENALAQNAATLDPKNFALISENLSFVKDQLLKEKQKNSTLFDASQELPKLDTSAILLNEEINDTDPDDTLSKNFALTLDVEFPSISDTGETLKNNIDQRWSSSGGTGISKMTPSQIEARQDELKVKLENQENERTQRKKSEQDKLQEQSESPEAQTMTSEHEEWQNSRLNPLLPEDATPKNENVSGMEKSSDNLNYFKIIPFEGREYATNFYNRFDPINGVWQLKTFETAYLLRQPYAWDNSPDALPIEGEAFIHQDQNPEIALPVREGYAIDVTSLRFENHLAKSYQLKRNAIGSYVLKIRGDSLKGSRVAFKLRKLAKLSEAEAPPTKEDSNGFLQTIPDFIRHELDPILKSVTDLERRALIIEAYILRHAVYTDNNDAVAPLIVAFINANGKDFQNRFNQMARILNQKNDLNYPRELLGHGLNCDLWSDFYIALARYYGVPTRKVSGFYNRLPRDTYLNGLERHAWVSIWSAKKTRWIWLEPTPRAGISSDQQDRLNEDEIFREHQSLDMLSAMHETPPKKDSGPAKPNTSEPEDFDWIMYTDPNRAAKLTPEQQEKFKKALEKYTQQENEYRLQRKAKNVSKAERLFEAMKKRNELFDEETKLTASFVKAAKIFNALSTKKTLSSDEQNFVKRYQQSRDQLLKHALYLLARPKHDPKNDPAMLTNEIWHALSILEPLIKMDSDDPQGRYKKLLDLAADHLSKTTPEALFEVVAENVDFLLVNGGKALYLLSKDGFSFEKINVDPSAYTEICQGKISFDGKHVALIAAIGETHYLIRDGVVSQLPFNTPFALDFIDAEGKTLVTTGEEKTETGYYSKYITLINDTVFRHVRHNSLTNQKGKVHLANWVEHQFDARGSSVPTESYLMVNGKKHLNPKTQRPYKFSPSPSLISQNHLVAVDKENFLVVVEDSAGRYSLKLNFEKEILPSQYSSISLNSDTDGKKIEISADNIQTNKQEKYIFEKNQLISVAIQKINIIPDDDDYSGQKITKHQEENGVYFYLNNEIPLQLSNGQLVVVKNGPYAFTEKKSQYLRIQNFRIGPQSPPLDRYLLSHIFILDEKRAVISPVPIYDANGNPVEFDDLNHLEVENGHYAFLARKGNRVYLVRDGHIDGSVPAQRANIMSNPEEVYISGSLMLNSKTDYIFWTNGGKYFPYTTWIDNVPLISHSKFHSIYINDWQDPRTAEFTFNIHNSRSFYLLGKEQITHRIENLRKFLIDKDVGDFTKRSERFLSKDHLEQNDLLYLVRNTQFHSHQNGGASAEALNANKKKIIENAVRVPALPMTRQERVSAVLDVLYWRATYELKEEYQLLTHTTQEAINSSSLSQTNYFAVHPELKAIARAAQKHQIGETILEAIKAQTNSTTWSALPSALREIMSSYYRIALAESGKNQSDVKKDW